MHKGEITMDILKIDEKAEVGRIADKLIDLLRNKLHRRGLVVGISGGVDSAVSTALCVEALGAKRVFGILMPEHDSSSESVSYGQLVVDKFGLDHTMENIGPTLEAIGCYRWRDEAIRKLFPEYGDDWKCKIAIAGQRKGTINHFNLVVQSPTGEISEKRMGLKEYLQVVAATNYKQRIRKTVEYFHADRLNYAVVGTPNRVEYDQGFFVKNGDGSADVKPIAHLYKTQVYALARYLGLPEEICNSTPSTDTYSMPQGQDEFYYTLPYDKMDVALWNYNHGVSAAKLAATLAIDEEHANFIYKDIEAKRSATQYHHMNPLLIEDVKIGS